MHAQSNISSSPPQATASSYLWDPAMLCFRRTQARRHVVFVPWITKISLFQPIRYHEQPYFVSNSSLSDLVHVLIVHPSGLSTQ